MRRLILDSSVYISAANPKDIFHLKSRSFISNLQERFPDTEIFVPTLVVLEVANILRISAEEILSIFSGGQIIEIDLELVEKIIPFFSKINLKASDGIIAACSNLYTAELVSWDKKLIKEAKKITTARTP